MGLRIILSVLRCERTDEMRKHKRTYSGVGAIGPNVSREALETAKVFKPEPDAKVDVVKVVVKPSEAKVGVVVEVNGPVAGVPQPVRHDSSRPWPKDTPISDGAFDR